jgi:hypothetical protein
MGFFDNLFNADSVMSGGAYWNIDSDERKLAICREAGERMAPAIGGSVKVREGGDEVHVTGQYGKHRVRAVIWVTFANIRIEVKPQKPLGISDFYLQFDAEAAKHAGEQLDRDEWDADEGDEKLYLSQHCYFEGSRAELRDTKTKFDQLPSELTGQLLQIMEQTAKDGTNFRIGEDEAVFYINDSEIVLSKSAAQRLAHVTHLVTSIISAAEQVWLSDDDDSDNDNDSEDCAHVAPAWSPPVQAPAAWPPALGPGSRVLVAWSDGHRYPATVVQAGNGQYLCSFPDGQQHWIGAAHLAPAS